jgi:hypothetical protein
MRVLVDTNVLLRSAQPNHAQAPQADVAIARLLREPSNSTHLFGARYELRVLPFDYDCGSGPSDARTKLPKDAPGHLGRAAEIGISPASWPAYNLKDQYLMNLGDTFRMERFNAAGVDLIAAAQADLRLAGSGRGTR